MEIYNMFRTAGTVGIFEGAAVCFLMSVAWHAYTVRSVTAWCDHRGDHKIIPWKSDEFQARAQSRVLWRFLTLDAITYCFSSSVPVQFIFFSKDRVKFSTLCSITVQHDSSCAAVHWQAILVKSLIHLCHDVSQRQITAQAEKLVINRGHITILHQG